MHQLPAVALRACSQVLRWGLSSALPCACLAEVTAGWGAGSGQLAPSACRLQHGRGSVRQRVSCRRSERELLGPRRSITVQPLLLGHCSWLWQVRAPMLPTHMFLIDVSYHAVSSGATAAACSAVAASLDCMQGAGLPTCCLRDQSGTGTGCSPAVLGG